MRAKGPMGFDPQGYLRPLRVESYGFPKVFHLEAFEDVMKALSSAEAGGSSEIEACLRVVPSSSMFTSFEEKNALSFGLFSFTSDPTQEQALPVWRNVHSRPLWLNVQIANGLAAAHRQFKKHTLSGVYHYLWWLGKEVEARAMQQAITENKEFVIYVDNSNPANSRGSILHINEGKDSQFCGSIVENEKDNFEYLHLNSVPTDPYLTTSPHASLAHATAERLLASRSKPTFSSHNSTALNSSILDSRASPFPPLVRLVDTTRLGRTTTPVLLQQLSTLQSELKTPLDSNSNSLTLCESFTRGYMEMGQEATLPEKHCADSTQPNAPGDPSDEEDFDSDEGDEAIKILNTRGFYFENCNNELQFSDDWFEAVEGTGNSPLQEGFDCSCWPFSLEAVTSEGLVYSLGMLVDPVSERYVFDGVPFREEVRILHTCVDFFESSRTDNRRDALESGPIHKTVRLLLREYTSIAKSFGGGIMIQTFSILPDEENEDGDSKPKSYNEDELDADTYQLIAPQKVHHLLWRCLPGALTRAFTLAPFMVLEAAAKKMSLKRVKSVPGFGRLDVCRRSREGIMAATLSLTGTPDFYIDSITQRKEANPTSDKMERMPLGTRELLAPEALWRYKQPNLFKWAMRHDPAELQVTADLFLNFLSNLTRAQELKRNVRRVLDAISVIQRFLRSCVLKKRRALQKMLRHWRQLEVGSRFRLQYYRPLCSAAGQIETIINNFLQQHMITSNAYKKQLIEELWEARRVAYCEWVKKQTHDVLACQHSSQCSHSTHMNSRGSYFTPSARDLAVWFNSVDDLDGLIMWVREHEFATGHDAGQETTSDSDAQSLSMMMSRFSEVIWPAWRAARRSGASDRGFKGRDDEHEEKLSSTPPQSRTCRSLEGDEFTREDTDNAREGAHFFRNSVRNTRVLSLNTRTNWQRQQDELHERFGWFIPPEDLLHESHQRLLVTLASSVLTREQTQHEIQRALQEVAALREPTPSKISKSQLTSPSENKRGLSISHGRLLDAKRTLSATRKRDVTSAGRSPLRVATRRDSREGWSRQSSASSRREMSAFSKMPITGFNGIERVKGSKSKTFADVIK